MCDALRNSHIAEKDSLGTGLFDFIRAISIELPILVKVRTLSRAVAWGWAYVWPAALERKVLHDLEEVGALNVGDRRLRGGRSARCAVVGAGRGLGADLQ